MCSLPIDPTADRAFAEMRLGVKNIEGHRISDLFFGRGNQGLIAQYAAGQRMSLQVENQGLGHLLQLILHIIIFYEDDLQFSAGGNTAPRYMGVSGEHYSPVLQPDLDQGIIIDVSGKQDIVSSDPQPFGQFAQIGIGNELHRHFFSFGLHPDSSESSESRPRWNRGSLDLRSRDIGITILARPAHARRCNGNQDHGLRHGTGVPLPW